MREVLPRQADDPGSDHRGAEFVIDIGISAYSDSTGYIAWVMVRRTPQMNVVALEEVRADERPWAHADQALAAAQARGRRLVFLEFMRSMPLHIAP
jgi:hypothetical protein